MEMMYEETRAAVLRDIIALKATEEPMLMRERRDIRTRLTQSAFTGTVNVGLNYSLSVAKRVLNK
jgi:hypothetical protein